MTVCDLCKGTGKLLKPWYDTTGAMTGMTGDICFMCDGKGTIGEPMTNEEWFCGLSTEEKAEFLNLIIRVGPYENEPKDFWECVYGRGGDRGTKSIVEWLKQPHREE